MIHAALAVLSLVLPVRDGFAWLKQAEEKLYRWPKPSVVVKFEAETDVLAPMIAAMKADLVKKPDVEAKRFVAALEHVKIHGSIDTGSGALTADVDVAYKGTDERTQKALEEIKRRVGMTIAGVFQGLPLNDPSLLRPGAKVTGCTESGDLVEIAIQGARQGETSTVRLSSSTSLPESIETPAFVGRYQFEEVSPRRFIPTRLDLSMRGQPESHAEYSYQKLGELLFPENVKVKSGDQTAVIKFRSLVIETRTP